MKYRELVESRSDGRPRPVSERAAVQGLLHSAACASCGSVDLCVYAWESDHFYCSQECRAKDVSLDGENLTAYDATIADNPPTPRKSAKKK